MNALAARAVRNSLINPLAHVHPDCTLGEGTRVWQFASVIRGARIGAGCNIASCAIVDGATLGDGCIVGHGASVHPGAWLGDQVFIGPGAVLCNDRWPRADKRGFDVEALLNGLVLVRIEAKASIGANAVILPGVVVGRNAMVAAGSVVNADVPANALWRRDGLIKPLECLKGHDRMRAIAC